ncbi:MAG: hypothetical protein AAF902_17170 [Chloroflexota bacterium]
MRLFFRLFTISILSLIIISCTTNPAIPVEPTPTSALLIATPMSTEEPLPSLQPLATVPSAPTVTYVYPTLTPLPEPTTIETRLDSVDELTIDGDCAALERPLTHSTLDSFYEIKSLVSNETCTLRFPAEQTFTPGGSMTDEGIYGSIYQNDKVELVRINFDSSITYLNVTAGGFFTQNIIISADDSQIIWSDGDGNPDNEDEFISKLWIANADGSEPRVIYEHTTDLTEALLVEIMMPIGILPNGTVLFSIEPAGRGGGWVYTGEHTNLVQTSAESVVKTENDLIFDCPEHTPFCVGDFTNDFSHFAYTDSQKNILHVVEMISGEAVWQLSDRTRSFIGRPQFNADKDLAFMAVDVIDEGNRLRPANGYIGIVDFPHAAVQYVPSERVSNLISWIGIDQLLHYELGDTVEDRRYPIITRDGSVVSEWEIKARFHFPMVID